jgi:MraZ protein
MTQFVGTHINRLDAKGRVSIPAPFRNALKSGDGGSTSLIFRPSHKHSCIEGWPAHVFHTLATSMQSLDIFGDDQDDLAFTIYADATELEPDREGRIVLPESLASFANLADNVAFVGMGRLFQIWEPAAAERRRIEARERVRARNLTLPGNSA